MSIGLRVVRGPDWNLGDADGGDGHTGTVVQTNTDGTVKVQWDMGKKTMSRSGKGGKHDVRLLDSACVGIRHERVQCDGCQMSVLLGTRWKCKTCDNYDLCSVCYNTDKHNLQHPFFRIDQPGTGSVSVPKRSASVKMRALGIFPGAEVIRGPNWEYGSQDGGSGKKGKVLELKNFGSIMAARNAVRVKWPSGEKNTYRLGFKGMVDVICVEQAPGLDYYRDHLANVDSLTHGDESNASDEATVESSLKVGDKVCVFLPEDALKQVQTGHGGWSRRMTECIGTTAIIKRFVGDSDVEIECDNMTWRFYTGAVRKVYDIKVGDMVKILDDKNTLKLLQKGHGGWNEAMSSTVGKIGKVVKKDSDGDVAVAFGRRAYVFNPACCSPAQGGKEEELGNDDKTSASADDEDDDDDDDDDNDGVDPADLLTGMIARMFLLDPLRAMVGPSQFCAAAAKGDVTVIQSMISKNKDIVNSRQQGLTALILASHQGHMRVVEMLIKAGAKKEDTDPKKNTALLAALAGNEEDVAIYLMINGCNINAANIHNRTAVHVAAFGNMTKALKILLDNGCDPNKKDAAGDTPLHDAIEKHHNNAIKLLVNCPKTELDIANSKGFNSIQLACLKDDDFAAGQIVARSPQLANQAKSDGYMPLHIAAINNHTDTATVLIKKGKANVNAKERKGLTPLHMAAMENYTDMVTLLTENGADVNVKDVDGDTPLHLALMGRRSETQTLLLLFGMRKSGADNEKVKTACFLIEHGANPELKNKRGATPLEVCSNQQVRNAVQTFVRRRQPGSQPTARSAAQSLAELFLDLPMPCMACHERIADVRFMPCRHRIECARCCFRLNECPVCDKDIDHRVDSEGRKIVQRVECPVQ